MTGGRPRQPVASPLGDALSRFHPVPSRFARYEISADDAARVTATSPEELAGLARLGLPHATGADGSPVFDYVDIVNLAMIGSRTGASVPELALRFLLRFAAGAPESWYEPRVWQVSVRVPALDRPRPGPAGDVLVRPPDLAAPGVEAAAAPGAPAAGDQPSASEHQVRVRLVGRPGRVACRQARDVFGEMRESLRSGTVTYQAVTEALRMDHRLAWRLGMADCVVVARLLADRLRAAGLRARARRGYLLGLVGSDHAWCELHEDGWWKPLDLVFAHLADGGEAGRPGWGSEEFASACCGSRFNRLLPSVSEEAEALIYVGGEPAPPWALAAVSARLWRP